MQLGEWLTLGGNLVLLGGLVAAIWQARLLAKQAQLATLQMESQLNWSRREATFAMMARYETELRDANLTLQKHLGILKQDGKVPLDDDVARVLEDDGVRLRVREAVSYLELLAIGVNTGYLDEEIARTFLVDAFVSSYWTLSPYLRIRREETGSRSIGENFEMLARKWDGEHLREMAHDGWRPQSELVRGARDV